MLKKLLIALFVYVCAAQTVSAQAPAPTLAPDRKWVPLQIELCSDADAKCSIPANDPKASRRFKLSVANEDENGNPLTVEDKLEPGSETYLFECIATSIGTVCTSAIPEIDNELYHEDRSKLLNQLLQAGGQGTLPPGSCGGGYRFEGIFSSQGGATANQPIMSDENGELIPNPEWQSCTPVVNKSFLALNYADPNRVTNQAGDLGGQQQTQIGFDKPVPTTAAKPTPVRNRRIRTRASREADPYGIVFDAQTLEPIPGASVLLTKLRPDGAFTKVNPYDPNDVIGGSIVNPYATRNDGYFNFIVPDGTYRLELPDDLNFNMKIATAPSLLNPSYAKLYSDIYPLNTGLNIIQKGKIQHRDIPVLTAKATNQTPELAAYFFDADKQSGDVMFNGRVNLPFTRMRFYSLAMDPQTGKPVRKQVLAETTADKDGKFDLIFSTKQLKTGETYGELELVKSDTFAKSTETTRTASVTMNPILNHLKGKAVNSKGEPMPYANVAIFLTMGTKPYYNTTADKDGNYEISSENIPPFPYSVRFTDTEGKKVNATTLQVALQNPEQNLNEYKRIETSSTVSAPERENIGSKPQKKTDAPNRTGMLPVLVGILVVVIAGVAVFAVLRRRKNAPPSAGAL